MDNLNIFSDTQELLLEHIKKIIDIGYKNNIRIIVFGCPKNRKININIDNNNIFINFFKRIGEYCIDKNIIICIEPNSKYYNCNYLNLIKEVGDIVKSINHNNIKMMVDIGNVIMENDNIYDIFEYKDIIYNIDISEDKMNNFINPNKIHYKFNELIKLMNYNKNINLEMLIKEDNCMNELNILNKSLENFINIYGV